MKVTTKDGPKSRKYSKTKDKTKSGINGEKMSEDKNIANTSRKKIDLKRKRDSNSDSNSSLVKQKKKRKPVIESDDEIYCPLVSSGNIEEKENETSTSVAKTDTGVDMEIDVVCQETGDITKKTDIVDKETGGDSTESDEITKKTGDVSVDNIEKAEINNLTDVTSPVKLSYGMPLRKTG